MGAYVAAPQLIPGFRQGHHQSLAPTITEAEFSLTVIVQAGKDNFFLSGDGKSDM